MVVKHAGSVIVSLITIYHMDKQGNIISIFVLGKPVTIKIVDCIIRLGVKLLYAEGEPDVGISKMVFIISAIELMMVSWERFTISIVDYDVVELGEKVLNVI